MSKKQDLQKMRHSAAHLLAHAVSELFPQTKLTIGPPTKEGFFYDFLPIENFKQEQLPLLEERMHEIAERNLTLTHEQMPKEVARKIFADNEFKLELIDGIPGDTVGISRQGDFYDLCRGGHVETTKEIQFFKLLGISGAYWRADRSGTALQRITGTAFLDEAGMEKYEQRQEELRAFDHRRLGKQMDLFSFHEDGVGFPFFHPKGKLIINLLIAFHRKHHIAVGYQEIETPIMLSSDLWKRSGHYEFYHENMYFSEVEGKSYAIKPMNCPGAFLLYNERPHSYRELPLRLNEYGRVHRNEISGALHGLMRVRSFTQDDAHIMCSPEVLEATILETIELSFRILQRFNFAKITVALSTKPVKAMGSDELWEKAENALKNALKACNIDYILQEGDGAFYGPKIDFNIQDSMEREWQCSTIQVDFFQPENFNMSYIDKDGTKKRPIIVHRTIYGSLERFFGILIEHYKGHFPFWLAPTQIALLTITDEQKEYAYQIEQELQAVGLRTMVDETSDPIAGKIKTAQLDKIPWMLVLGQKEADSKTLTLRYHTGKQNFGITLDKLISLTREEVAE